MSWQAYVDDQLLATKMVSHAVICGHDGSIWAQSAGFAVKPAEITTFVGKFGNTNDLAASGVTFAGVKYMFLSSNESVVRAKKGTSGVHVVKTKQAYVISLYEEPIVTEQCASVTEKLGDYLSNAGY